MNVMLTSSHVSHFWKAFLSVILFVLIIKDRQSDCLSFLFIAKYSLSLPTDDGCFDFKCCSNLPVFMESFVEMVQHS